MFTIVSSLSQGYIDGCFFNRVSQTLCEDVLGSIKLSQLSGWPILSTAISLSSTLTLPSIIFGESSGELVDWCIPSTNDFFLHSIHRQDFHPFKGLGSVPDVSRVLSFSISSVVFEVVGLARPLPLHCYSFKSSAFGVGLKQISQTNNIPRGYFELIPSPMHYSFRTLINLFRGAHHLCPPTGSLE